MKLLRLKPHVGETNENIIKPQLIIIWPIIFLSLNNEKIVEI